MRSKSPDYTHSSVILSCYLIVSFCYRLAAEMNHKLAQNESSLENVTIPTRPMTVAEEYCRVKCNAWLDAKMALDERLPAEADERAKVEALTNILLVTLQLYFLFRCQLYFVIFIVLSF